MTDTFSTFSIQKLVRELSKNFKQLEGLIKDNKMERVNIGFPRGVIRKASEYRAQLPVIKDGTFKRNIAYHLMLNDVYRWLLNRFDIDLTAKEMIIKEGICLFGNITAAIVKNLAQKNTTSRMGLKLATTILMQKGIITEDLRKELRWIWGIRNKEHIESLIDMEYQKYNTKDYDRAIRIWHALVEQLTQAKEKGII